VIRACTLESRKNREFPGQLNYYQLYNKGYLVTRMEICVSKSLKPFTYLFIIPPFTSGTIQKAQNSIRVAVQIISSK
jgi:hypothetical protein